MELYRVIVIISVIAGVLITILKSSHKKYNAKKTLEVLNKEFKLNELDKRLYGIIENNKINVSCSIIKDKIDYI